MTHIFTLLIPVASLSSQWSRNRKETHRDSKRGIVSFCLKTRKVIYWSQALIGWHTFQEGPADNKY